ncbi:MAG: hypothetical protein FJ134_16435 [Deltaproteobacteria bacterium]|nr:hypothetical protein [Deltaproteobacteria bacterium]
MGEVVDLERFRTKLAADQGFRTWLARFQEQFGPETRLQDLSDQTLLYLASPGEENLYVYFDLVMGAQGLGGSLRFRLDDLDNATKLKIMDVAFALMDRVRFEVMRRLGWVGEVLEQDTPIIQLVRQAVRRGQEFAREVPRLAPSHPDYPAYAKLRAADQTVFLRRLIPRAVGEFEARVSKR